MASIKKYTKPVSVTLAYDDDDIQFDGIIEFEEDPGGNITMKRIGNKFVRVRPGYRYYEIDPGGSDHE
jgi:hypothetical protein